MKFIRRRVLDEGAFNMPARVQHAPAGTERGAGERQNLSARDVVLRNAGVIKELIAGKVCNALAAVGKKIKSLGAEQPPFTLMTFHADGAPANDASAYLPAVSVTPTKDGKILVAIKIMANLSSGQQSSSALSYGKGMEALASVAEKLEDGLNKEYGGIVSVKYEQYAVDTQGSGRGATSSPDVILGDGDADGEKALSAMRPVQFPQVPGYVNKPWEVSGGCTFSDMLDFMSNRVTSTPSTKLVAFFNEKSEVPVAAVPSSYGAKLCGVLLYRAQQVDDISWVKGLCRVDDPCVIYKMPELTRTISTVEQVNAPGELYYEKATNGAINRKMLQQLRNKALTARKMTYIEIAYYLASGKVRLVDSQGNEAEV